MAESHPGSAPNVGRGGWLAFATVELICVAGFLALQAVGWATLALGFLFGPLQLLAWFVLLRDELWLLLAFVAVLPIACIELLPPAYQLYVYYPSSVLLLAVLLATGFVEPVRSRGKLLRGGDLVPILIMGAWIVLSLVNAVNRGWASTFLFKYTVINLELLAIGLFAAAVPRNVTQVRVCVHILIGATTLTAFIIPLLPAPVGDAGIMGGKLVMTPFSIFNLNHYGGVVAAVAAMSLALVVTSQNRRTQLLLGAALLPLCAVMIMTRSRGAWLGFAMAFIYLTLRVGSFRLVVVAVILAVTLLASDIVRGTLFARAGQTSIRDPSLAGRAVLWSYAWHIGSQNWLFGVGSENFRYVKHLFGYPLSRAVALKYNSHNLYLEYFTNLGAVGLGCLLWMLFGAVWRADRLARKRARETWGMGAGMTAAVLVYLVHGLVDSYLYVPAAAAILAVIVGLCVALGRVAASGPTPGGGPEVQHQ